VSQRLLEKLKSYVSFGAADAAALSELRPLLAPEFKSCVDEFYDALLRDEDARRILEQSSGGVDTLRSTLMTWLDEMLTGPQDHKYYEQRSRIGRRHVVVGLPQYYMFAAMNVLRRSLASRVRRLALPDVGRQLDALHKILDIELALMNETYREDQLAKLLKLEQRQFEEKLSESEHLAGVGQLAASVAHEIKNPLAGISGAIQVMGAGLGADHPHPGVIQDVLEQIDRLDSVVCDLLVYARPSPPRLARVDLSKTLRRAVILLREEPSFAGLTIDMDGIADDCIVHADDMQVQQVITNLMLNAAHACESGGRITCAVDRDGAMAVMGIEDDGVGIPEHTRKRIFEPFFTTKTKGTGLGLLICRRIIEAHGGVIKIDSAVGRGTRVTVRLPIES
jgi:signal transduction histidine kinase